MSTDDLYKYGPLMEKKMNTLKTITAVVSDIDITEPQAKIEILRDRASQYNITATQIENALNLSYATSNLSPINTSSYQYYAIMETFPYFYRNPTDLKQIWLRNTDNKMVPFTLLLQSHREHRPPYRQPHRWAPLCNHLLSI